jgi:putative ABC transport system permease protein
MLSDLRFAFRQLLKSPGFTFVAVATLAIGIGANTAIFSFVNALLLNPLPYPEADRLVVINEAPPGGRNASCGGTFLEWYDHNEHFDRLAAFHPVNKIAAGLGEPLQLAGWEVTAEFLQVYRITPAMGRDFRPEDDAPGGDHQVAIVTHEFWQNHLGGRPSVLGELLRLDGTGYAIIGVLPPAALMDPTVQFLSPAGIRSVQYKQDFNYSYVTNAVGRLKAGSTPELATAQLTAVKQGLRERYPAYKKDWAVAVDDMQESMFGNNRDPLLLLLIAVGAVLLIACANIANLLLARTASRQGEIALRLSLGASKGRVMRQLLTESIVLGLAGGAAGIWLGVLAIDPLVSFSGLNEVQGLAVGLNLRVLAFAFTVAVLCSLLFGTLPALQAVQGDLNQQLKEGTRSTTAGKRRQLQSILIVTETALTVVLLVGAGLLLRSFANVTDNDPGFVREGVLTFQVSQSGATAQTVEKRTQFTDAVLRELSSIPGVAAAGMISALPMNGQSYYGDFIHRMDRPETADKNNTGFDAVSPDFFKAMGIPLIRGRVLTPADNHPDAPRVMVVNSVFVERWFDEGEDPIGAQLFFKGAAWEIVGVVGSVRRFALEGRPSPQVYHAQAFFPWYTHYVVPTSLPPLSLGAQVRQAVRRVDSDQPIANLSTPEIAARNTLRGRTTVLLLIGAFAGVALLLACIGIYGVMAYAVAQRTRELGIRLALGAATRDVIHLILHDGLRLLLLGVVLGAVGAGFASQILAAQLYEVGRFDPAVFAGVAVTLVAAGFLACWLPARRATKVDPIIALRAE